jgi:hypothetical protein
MLVSSFLLVACAPSHCGAFLYVIAIADYTISVSTASDYKARDEPASPGA